LTRFGILATPARTYGAYGISFGSENISYIVLVFGVMAVLMVLGFGSDQLGPFGAMIMMMAALVLFVVIGLRSGIGRPETTRGAGGSGASWASLQGLAVENWLDLVIAPDLVALAANGVEASTDSELNTVRLFAQEIVVTQLRTTDVISNSVMPAVTIALLPETDGPEADIAVGRIRNSLAESELSIGIRGQTELPVSVMAINYPEDVRDTMGFIEQIQQFEERLSPATASG
jgi:uncharacterized membrane protein